MTNWNPYYKTVKNNVYDDFFASDGDDQSNFEWFNYVCGCLIFLNYVMRNKDFMTS